MDRPVEQQDSDRLEAERQLLERLAKRKKGRPDQRERHGGNSWRHWIDGDTDE